MTSLRQVIDVPGTAAQSAGRVVSSISIWFHLVEIGVVTSGIGPDKVHFPAVLADPLRVQLETVGSVVLAVGVESFRVVKLRPWPVGGF
jgi:hypothetical protein